MGKTSLLPVNLPQLQNLIKRDSDSYSAEFEQQYQRYESNLQVFLLSPTDDSKTLTELTTFIAQVSHCYPKLVKDFPQQLHDVLDKQAHALNPEVRMVFVRALILLKNKGFITASALFHLFFQLFRCQDKTLRQVIYDFIIQDIKNMNIKRKNNKLNKTLQNFMYTMLNDNNAMASKMSLDVMIELYHKKIWNDAKTVNVISSACFSKVRKVLASALRFFLTDSSQQEDNDSEPEEDGPSARDIIIRFACKKKTVKAKQRKTKALKALHKQKKKDFHNNDFAAIHLIHDSQSFVERLFKQLQTTKECFDIKLLMLNVIARIIGVEKLLLYNFYPFLQRFLQPHQKDVTKILLASAQACHDLVPPEIIHPTIMTIANNFISERNSSEVMAVGLNSVREICARCPLAMSEDLLQDLTQYKTAQNKTVTSAARSLIQLYRNINPKLLTKKDRGKPNQSRNELAIREYGQVDAKDYISGAEALLNEDEEDGDDDDEEQGVEVDSDDGEGWQNVPQSDDEVDGEDGSDGEEGDENKKDTMTTEEKIEAAKLISHTRILTDQDFQKIRANQAMKNIIPSRRQTHHEKAASLNTSNVTDPDSNTEIVQLDNIELVNKKRPRDRETRLAMVLAGREGREKFGGVKRQKLDPNASTTNKVKKKKKQFMMVREKMKKKQSGRSFRDKQIALRNSLLKRKKSYKFGFG